MTKRSNKFVVHWTDKTRTQNQRKFVPRDKFDGLKIGYLAYDQKAPVGDKFDSMKNRLFDNCSKGPPSLKVGYLAKDQKLPIGCQR